MRQNLLVEIQLLSANDIEHVTEAHFGMHFREENKSVNIISNHNTHMRLGDSR